MCTLPEDSATVMASTGYRVSLATLFLALIVDTLRQIASGFGGKRLPKSQLLVPSLALDEDKQQAMQDLLAAERAAIREERAARAHR